MAKKYFNKFSPSLAIKRLQIKPYLKFYLTTVRMVTIKKTKDNKCWWGYEQSETFMHCQCECRLV